MKPNQIVSIVNQKLSNFLPISLIDRLITKKFTRLVLILLMSLSVTIEGARYIGSLLPDPLHQIDLTTFEGLKKAALTLSENPYLVRELLMYTAKGTNSGVIKVEGGEFSFDNLGIEDPLIASISNGIKIRDISFLIKMTNAQIKEVITSENLQEKSFTKSTKEYNIIVDSVKKIFDAAGVNVELNSPTIRISEQNVFVKGEFRCEITIRSDQQVVWISFSTDPTSISIHSSKSDFPKLEFREDFNGFKELEENFIGLYSAVNTDKTLSEH